MKRHALKTATCGVPDMSPAAKARGAERVRHAARLARRRTPSPNGSRGRSIGRSQAAFQGSGRMRTEGGGFQLRALASGSMSVQLRFGSQVQKGAFCRPSLPPLVQRSSWSWRAEFCTDAHPKRFERDFAASALGDFEGAYCPRLGECLEKPCKSMRPLFPKPLLGLLILLASAASLGSAIMRFCTRMFDVAAEDLAKVAES